MSAGGESGRHRKRWRSATPGIALVHRASGIVPSTIGKGIKELRERQDGETEPEERRRVRRPRGGRPSKTSEDQQCSGRWRAWWNRARGVIPYKNGGREYRPKGRPEQVDVHDFKGELGRVSPYGVYDMKDNSGWVSVGVSADTSEFAVESIRRWWNSVGYERYSQARELFITADCGGSNGYRTRLWKLELQRLADELGVPITVCHFPPGTSKWNKIEHRLFSFITIDWRGNHCARTKLW